MVQKYLLLFLLLLSIPVCLTTPSPNSSSNEEEEEEIPDYSYPMGSCLEEESSFITCRNETNENGNPRKKHIITIINSLFSMVLIPFVSILGIFGNLTSVAVLVSQRMRKCMNMMLASLAVSDTLVLLHSLLYASLTIFSTINPIQGNNIRNRLFPFFGAYGSIVCARITSSLSTLLSFERFVAVYFPFHIKRICGKKATYFAIASIYIITMILFIPFSLKYTTFTMVKQNTSYIMLKMTKLGETLEVYSLVLNILYRFMPVVIQAVLNILIIISIRKTSAQVDNAHYDWKQRLLKRQCKVTVMVLMVTFIFLLCISPGAVHSIITMLLPNYSRLGKFTHLHMTISCITYFLETLNSSVNFIIYIMFSSEFNQVYQEKCFCCKKKKKNVPRFTLLHYISSKKPVS